MSEESQVQEEPRKTVSPTGVAGTIFGGGVGGFFGHKLSEAFSYGVGTPSYLSSVILLSLLGVAFGVLAARWVSAQMTRPAYSPAG